MDWSRVVDGYCERVGITCESTDNEYVEFLTGYYPGYGAICGLALDTGDYAH